MITKKQLVNLIKSMMRDRNKDVMMMSGGGVVEDIQKNQISLVDWFADFFATQ